jgi:hypothetical protein
MGSRVSAITTSELEPLSAGRFAEELLPPETGGSSPTSSPSRNMWF